MYGIFLIGIFVADDQIIVGLQEPVASGKYDVDGLDIAYVSCEGKKFLDAFEQSLKEGARLARRRSLDVESLAVAVPGPVKASGFRVSHRNKLKSDYGTFGQHTRRADLKDKNISHIISESSAIHVQKHILVYHDAAAYGYGDYVLRRNEHAARSASHLSDFKLETHFLLLIDEGVGGSVITEGIVAQGPSHPEVGHCIVSRHPEDNYHSYCNVHKREGCLESLVSLPALRRRWPGLFIHDKRDHYSSWSETDERLWLVAYYISQLITNAILFLCPSRIVLCGRVITMNTNLIKMVRGYVCEMLAVPDGSNGLYPGYSFQDQRVRPDFIDVVRDENCGVFGAAMLATEVEMTAKLLRRRPPPRSRT